MALVLQAYAHDAAAQSLSRRSLRSYRLSRDLLACGSRSIDAE